MKTIPSPRSSREPSMPLAAHEPIGAVVRPAPGPVEVITHSVRFSRTPAGVQVRRRA